jgi:hypothetical protein
MREYQQAPRGYVVCQVKHKIEIEENIYALPWQNFTSYLFDQETK